jgi:hypothetical protein
MLCAFVTYQPHIPSHNHNHLPTDEAPDVRILARLGHLLCGDPGEAPGVMAVLPSPDVAHANHDEVGVAWRSRAAAGGRLHRGRGEHNVAWRSGSMAGAA